MIALLLAILAGLLNGARELTHANPRIFEQRFGANPGGYWGSLSWQRKQDGRGANITVLSDFWHTSEFLIHGFLIGAALAAGIFDLPVVAEIQMPMVARWMSYYCLLHGCFGAASWAAYKILKQSARLDEA